MKASPSSRSGTLLVDRLSSSSPASLRRMTPESAHFYLAPCRKALLAVTLSPQGPQKGGGRCPGGTERIGNEI